jgi:hypothetical protein
MGGALSYCPPASSSPMIPSPSDGNVHFLQNDPGNDVTIMYTNEKSPKVAHSPLLTFNGSVSVNGDTESWIPAKSLLLNHGDEKRFYVLSDCRLLGRIGCMYQSAGHILELEILFEPTDIGIRFSGFFNKMGDERGEDQVVREVRLKARRAISLIQSYCGRTTADLDPVLDKVTDLYPEVNILSSVSVSLIKSKIYVIIRNVRCQIF